MEEEPINESPDEALIFLVKILRKLDELNEIIADYNTWLPDDDTLEQRGIETAIVREFLRSIAERVLKPYRWVFDETEPDDPIPLIAVEIGDEIYVINFDGVYHQEGRLSINYYKRKFKEVYGERTS